MDSKETLDSYIRNRAKALGMSLSSLSKASGVGRQTLYDLAGVPHKMPSLPTLIALAGVLQVHPLRLLHLVFDATASDPEVANEKKHPQDRSTFVRDVTHPDGALVLCGQRFTKIWELQNVGKVAWENRFLRCIDEEIVVYTRSGEKLEVAQALAPVEPRVPVPYTAPGALAQIQAEFIAPSQPCTVLSYWKSVFADDSPCFPHSVGLWVKVRVTNMASATPEPRRLQQFGD